MDPSRYEHLGAFYLGHRVRDGARTDEPILYDAKDLTTHGLCVGMTGSGKTGLSAIVLEEAAIDGVPAIAIDPKGDLGNLMLAFPDVAPADFAPWVDSTEDPARVAERFRAGLAASGQDGARIARFAGSVERAIYTPGSTAGRPLAVLGRLAPPPRAIRDDPEALAEEVSSSVSALCALIDADPDPVASSEHILLSTLLTRAWAEERSLDVAELVRQVLDPPFDRVGALPLDQFFAPADRKKLGMRLNHLLASPAFAPWMSGEPLDVGSLLYAPDGRPRLSILSIAHLGDRERMFFVTLLLSRVIAWMRTQPGTSSLRALLFMDEVFGFFPPVAEPPSKRPMLTLLKQARAHGLGVLLATQNPVDLDYRGLSNCGTWLLGRLSTERDVDRVIEGLAGASTAPFDAETTRRELAGLGPRRFLMRNVHEREPVTFETRWALSYLRGPLTRAQIARLSSERAPPAPTAHAPPPPPAGAARPALELPERFLAPLPGRGALEWRAGLLASARLHYVHRPSGLDAWVATSLLSREASWEGAEIVDPHALRFADAPEGGAWSDVPRAVTAKGGLAALAKALKSHLVHAHVGHVFYSEPHRAWSAPGETQAAMVARMALLDREARDRAVQALRERYAPEVRRLEDRIERARDRVARERDQYSARKVDTAVSVGTTVLGALFGRSVLGRATTAARGAARASRDREDVQRAEQAVAELERELEELEAALADDLRALEAAPFGAPVVSAREVRPAKGDLEVIELAVAWIPWRRGEDGVAREAWRDATGAG